MFIFRRFLPVSSQQHLDRGSTRSKRLIKRRARSTIETSATFRASIKSAIQQNMDGKRVINFAAGPAKLPDEVLKTIQKDLFSYNNSGISMLELSHRSTDFMNLVKSTEETARNLLNIPSNYKIIFLQGGGTGQFAAVPLNLMNTGQADYVVTGSWSSKAVKEASKYGIAANVVPKSHTLYTSIPRFSDWELSSGASYLYYCDNETINGVEFNFIPETGTDVPLVCDMSSNIMSRKFDITKFGAVFAGAQKNIGCAGTTMVIIREDLIGSASNLCPSIWDYKIQCENGSLYNTPPTFSLYSISLVLEWAKKEGGIDVLEHLAEKKSQLLYDIIDSSNGFYTNPIQKEVRSRMNVPFRITKNDDGGDLALEKEFIEGARQRGMVELKGHRSVGGIRASLYNAVTFEDVQKLTDFMSEFMDGRQ
uniref:Phosphoserine aminotransferase n=1 Tax=Strigamia maritima TaxID=126957 RepID=T1J3S3_STRMM